jgi:aspartate ammonia-lyase
VPGNTSGDPSVGAPIVLPPEPSVYSLGQHGRPRLPQDPDEHDLLGDWRCPRAYYGIQTARALENFQISGVEISLYPNFIKALAMVKLAAARANFESNQLSRDILAGIEGACQEIIGGKLHDQFKLTSARRRRH